MALQPLRSLRLPACSSCLQWIGASAQQIRGAKKMLKNPMLTVQLLQDIPKFGRKGIIMQVSKGRMRNLWFPRGMARYLSNHDLKNIKHGEVMLERDLNFRPDLERQKGPTVDLNLLDADQSFRLLESMLPESIEFARSTTSDLEVTLHGSITIADIASTIREMAAAGDGDVSRVVIKPEDISFVENKKQEKIDKIQRLGTYPFMITIKEGLTLVRNVVVTRQVSVLEGNAGQTAASG